MKFGEHSLIVGVFAKENSSYAAAKEFDIDPNAQFSEEKIFVTRSCCILDDC